MKNKSFWAAIFLFSSFVTLSAGSAEAQGVTFPGGSVTWGSYDNGANYPGGRVTWGPDKGGVNVQGGDIGVNWNSSGRGSVNINIPGTDFKTNIRW